MNLFKTAKGYLGWHYLASIKDFFVIWRNFISFLFGFFSIILLLKTFFTPFKRLDEGYSSVVDTQKFVDTFIINSIMRVFGMIFRSVIILMGLISILFFIILSFVLFLVWLFLPLLILIGFITSLFIIFS